MSWSIVVPCLVVMTLLAGCISIKFGREFPSAGARGSGGGKSDKAALGGAGGEA